MTSESQKRASKKYLAEKTDDVRLRVPKGTKELYRIAAQKKGTSLTQFIIDCVEKELGVFDINDVLLLIEKYHASNCENNDFLFSINKAIEQNDRLLDIKDLIEAFISNLPNVDNVMNEWLNFVSANRDIELNTIISNYHLKDDETRLFMEQAFRNGEFKMNDSDAINLINEEFCPNEANNNSYDLLCALSGFFRRYQGIGWDFSASEEGKNYSFSDDENL